MSLSATAPATVDEIVDGLKDHVWTLLCRGHLDAALSLVCASVDDYLRIVGTWELPTGTPPDSASAEGSVEVAEVQVQVLDVSAVDPGATWQIPLQVGGKQLMLTERGK